MSEFPFDCRPDCGGCCAIPPDMSVGEGFGYFRAFVLDFLVRAHRDPRSVPRHMLTPVEARSFDLQCQVFDWARDSNSPVMTRRQTGEVFALIAVFRPIYAISTGKCPHLDGAKLCDMYEQRPAMCRLAPFNFFAPLAAQRDALGLWREFADIHGQKCDFTGGPSILTDGEMTDAETRRVFDWAQAAYRETTGPALRLLVNDPAFARNEQALAHLYNGASLTLHPLMALESFLRMPMEKRPCAVPDLAEFSAAQMALIDALLGDILARKNRGDRPATDRLRVLRQGYAQVGVP